MIDVAQATLDTQQVSTGQYEYVQGSAESMPFLKDGSVDLVIAGACLRQEKFDFWLTGFMRSQLRHVIGLIGTKYGPSSQEC